jgi:16S rRNA C1402 N4-methylase RsmH
VILCRSMGDLSRARYYCEYCLAHVADDPWALCDLADVLFQQGEADLAKRHAAKSYAQVAQSDSKKCQDLLELLNKKWPEIGEWRA